MKGMRKKKIIPALAVIGLIGAAAVYTVAGRGKPEEETIVYKEETAAFGDLMQSITESGIIELQTKNQTYDIVLDDENDDDENEDDEDEEESRYLKIEEVYVKQGQRVKEGQAILKVTDRSIRLVRRYLASEAADAEIALEELQNQYEIEKVKAGNTYQESMSDFSWAEIQYAIDTQEINLEIVRLANSVSVLEQEIRQIETDLENSWDDYADLKEEYEKYERRYNEWDKDNLYTYIPLRTEYLNIKEQYETETENREDKRQEMADKQEEIQEIQEDIIRLQGETERKEMEARQSYESAVLDGSMAEDVYTYSLASLEKNIETAQQELEELRGKLADFDAFTGEEGIVYAESDGLITQVYYEAGDTLQEESTLITYVKEDSYVLSIDISEEDIPYVNVGDEVTVAFTAYPGETYAGRIEEIVSTQTSQATATVSYPVTVKIEGDTSGLYGGMTGDVTFVTDQVLQAVYVPRKAVTTEDGTSYVLIKEENGEMSRKEVVTGFTDGTNIQIISGLSEGDTVLIESRIRVSESAETENEAMPDSQEGPMREGEDREHENMDRPE